jgi:tRNA A37 threonylcarbamoyladenosine synthetase subunit TsaC/SUA5/YrdC
VITLVPEATPVTNPTLLTVATDVLVDTHGLTAAAVPDPLSPVVNPKHTVSVPVMIGKLFTVTLAVCEHPLLFV